MSKHILILAGDGIGPEIMAAAEKVLAVINQQFALDLTWSHGLLGGCSIDHYGVPLADETLAAAQAADAILLGAVGGYKWDNIERSIRPERGLLKIRSALNLFANLRPAILYPQLADASSLKPEIVAGLDILIVRELTGGIYFGQPRGVRTLENGERQGYNTDVYSESEIRRIGRVAFEARIGGGELWSPLNSTGDRDHVRLTTAELVELNIGHFIVGEALAVGMAEAVRRMREVMAAGRRDLARRSA